MKNVMILCGIIAAITTTGCKSIEVERNANSVATVETADGKYEVIRDAAGNPVILDGGWSVDYFQHWNWQKFDELHAKAGENVSLDINGYASGADSNLTALVETSFAGGTKLVTAIGEAYVKIAGGGAQADTVLSSAAKIYNYFASKGGDVTKATVTTNSASNTVQVTDGTTCITCDKDGNCTDCTYTATTTTN